MSPTEQFMIEALTESEHPLSLAELVEKIQKKDPDLLQGATPKKSLYSMIYRREKRRRDLGLTQKFKTSVKSRVSFYELFSEPLKGPE